MPFGLQSSQPPPPPTGDIEPIHISESAGNGDLETLRTTLPSLGIGELRVRGELKRSDEVEHSCDCEGNHTRSVIIIRF